MSKSADGGCLQPSKPSSYLAWPESYDSALAIRTIDELGSQVKVHWRTVVITAESREDVGTEWPDTVWDSIISLLSRPWLERL